MYDKFRGHGYFVFLNFSLFPAFGKGIWEVAAILRGCFRAREVLLLLGLGERLNSLALRLRNCTLAPESRPSALGQMTSCRASPHVGHPRRSRRVTPGTDGAPKRSVATEPPRWYGLAFIQFKIRLVPLQLSVRPVTYGLNRIAASAFSPVSERNPWRSVS